MQKSLALLFAILGTISPTKGAQAVASEKKATYEPFQLKIEVTSKEVAFTESLLFNSDDPSLGEVVGTIVEGFCLTQADYANLCYRPHYGKHFDLSYGGTSLVDEILSTKMSVFGASSGSTLKLCPTSKEAIKAFEAYRDDKALILDVATLEETCQIACKLGHTVSYLIKLIEAVRGRPLQVGTRLYANGVPYLKCKECRRNVEQGAEEIKEINRLKDWGFKGGYDIGATVFLVQRAPLSLKVTRGGKELFQVVCSPDDTEAELGRQLLRLLGGRTSRRSCWIYFTRGNAEKEIQPLHGLEKRCLHHLGIGSKSKIIIKGKWGFDKSNNLRTLGALAC